MPLFEHSHLAVRVAVLQELEPNEGFIEGYQYGCAATLEKYSPDTIYADLKQMRPQASKDLATCIYQKLRFFRRYIPEYQEVLTKKYRPDDRPMILPPYQPTSDIKKPEFQRGKTAGIAALNTLYQRYIAHFQNDYQNRPPHEVWVANTDIRKRIDKMMEERDKKSEEMDALLRKPVKPVVVERT